MLSRWVSFLKPRGHSRIRRHKGSLVRTVLVMLLVVSLLPVLLVGTFNYFRTQNLLRQQITSQLENIVTHETGQLDDFVATRDQILERMLTEHGFKENLLILTDPLQDYQDRDVAKAFLTLSFKSAGLGVNFDQIFLIDENGKVLIASDDKFITDNFGGTYVRNAAVRALDETNQAVFRYNVLDGYQNRMVLFMSRSFKDANGKFIGTLVAISGSNLFSSILSDSSAFLPGVESFYFTADTNILGPARNSTLMQMPSNPTLISAVKPYIGNKTIKFLFPTRTMQDAVGIAYAGWNPSYGIGVITQAPEKSAFQQNNLADPFNIMVLLGSLLISGAMVFFSTTRLVNPLVSLAKAADTFSQGNFSERTSVNRNDEIGLLAASFNHMADELSEMYHSLETVVSQRTSQLRIASEIAEQATSSTKLSETLGRTVELIAERFGFYHVSMYLYDENGENLVLREAGGESAAEIKKQGARVDKYSNTLISWVAVNNQSRIVSDVESDKLFRANELLPDTHSELAIPITVENKVMGVLDIQSTLLDIFTEDTISVFQTLSNQISSTLQTTRLLETTQISYEETNLLYGTTREITEARSEAEIIDSIANTLVKVPFIGSVLSVEGENFKILALTDSKTGKVETSLQSLNIPIGRMVSLLEENRLVVIKDITQPNDFDNMVSFLLRRGLKAAALMAVMENGQLSKVLILSTHDADLLTPTRLEPYQKLAELLGPAIEKFQILQILQTRLTELQTLANFSQALSAETDLRNLYRVLHEQVTQTLGSGIEFGVAIYNEQKNLIEFPYFYENGKEIAFPPAKLGQGLTSQVIQTRQPLLLSNDAAIRKSNPLIEGRPPRSWLGIPLIFGGSIVGAVIVQDLNNENRFDQDDVSLFLTLAPQIATSVRNTQLYTETQQALSAYDQERFLLNTLLDNMPEGISFKDPHGRYIRASDSVARIFNANPLDLIGKSDYDLMDRETAEKTFHDEQMVMNIGQPEIGLIQHIVTPAGEESWVHTSRIPIRTATGDPYGLLIIQRDVTTLKQAEALSQRRAEQVLTAAEIARDTTGTLDVHILLQKSINLVRDRFGFYHASVFLIDPAREYAILQESTGEAGEKMLQAGHRLAVGSKSIVGQVSATGNPLIVNNVTSDPTHLPNPYLPDTRSELGLPLKVGERILGVIDVQSTHFNAFNQEDVNVLGILADQLAVAVVNGDLFAKTQELLGKHRLLRQISIAASTSTSMEDAIVNVVRGLRTAMVGDRIAVLMINDDGKLQIQASAGYEGATAQNLRLEIGQGIVGIAAAEKRPVRVDDTLADSRYVSIDPEIRSELAIPILFSDELIGVLNLESKQSFAFDENDQEILGALGNNLGGVIANIRLVNRVRQQVIRERQLFDVTSKIRHSVDLETILETSAKEIARALGASRATIHITAGETPSQPETRAQDSGGASMPNNNVIVKRNGSNGKAKGNGSNGNGHKNGQENNQ